MGWILASLQAENSSNRDFDTSADDASVSVFDARKRRNVVPSFLLETQVQTRFEQRFFAWNDRVFYEFDSYRFIWNYPHLRHSN